MELYCRDKSAPCPRDAERPELARMLGCLGAWVLGLLGCLGAWVFGCLGEHGRAR